MNWRRGLFRLWIVGAVAFGVLILLFQGPAVSAEFEKAEYQRIWDREAQKPGTAENFLLRYKPENPLPEDMPARPWHLLGNTIALAIGVPAGTFCLGLIFMWIGRGFHPNPKKDAP